MKNVKRVENLAEARQLHEAIRRFTENFEHVFFERLLNHDLHRLDNGLTEDDTAHLEKILRNPAWNFSSELSRDLFPGPNSAYRSWSDEERFAEYEEQVPKWEARTKAKARAFWKQFDEAVSYFTTITSKPGFSVSVPDREQVSMHGFSVLVIEYDLEPDKERQAEYMARFREGLRVFRSRARKVLPLMLQAMLPIELIAYLRGVNDGGLYAQDHIEFSLRAFEEFKQPTKVANVIAHEMGHHIFQTYLSAADQKFWSEAIEGNYGPLDVKEALRLWPEGAWLIDMAGILKDENPTLAIQLSLLGRFPGGGKRIQRREDFEKAVRDGEVFNVPQNPITAYAGKNPQEAFCEAIGMLVAYGPRALDPLVLGWLVMILPTLRVASMAARVAQRFSRRIALGL